MYAYTTGEYFNGDANLNSDGTFYFRRCWTGAKQFRLIRIEDNAWITTLEFPLLIRSYWMPEDADPEVIRVMKDRCYTYDQALAALALMVQRHEAVERYVAGLCALVDENGGVKFFVNRLSAMSPRTYYRLGNAAWVYYALAFYLEKYPDGTQTARVREKLLAGIAWLDTFLVSTPGDLREGLYKGGQGRYVDGNFDETFVAEWCALEHNVDIWFLFELMGRLGFDGFSERADRLAKSIIRGLWVEDEGRFRQGVHSTHYDNAAALDQSSWGGLFVANIDAEKAAKCRKYMGRFLFGTRETTGYTPYHPDYGYSGHSRGVWVEGTAGVALFERKLGNELNAVNLVAAMAPLFNEYGYRDSCDDPAYDVLPSWSSTTNTAWIILAVKPDNFWLVDSPEMDVGTIRY
ncbi:phage tail protein, partial [Escherichia coli]|nr:phage tail protein [Escherichia coli]EYV90034.1 tail fiber protein [Escherichia coli O6:H16 str. 99-3165]EZA77768.1 tail fiber protein [Escherichia coli O6:H16 str. F5656C1]EHL1058182.1 phage tail protein [Escherichia coli]EIY1840758.1 phage tail protein [Escherichia coli]